MNDLNDYSKKLRKKKKMDDIYSTLQNSCKSLEISGTITTIYQFFLNFEKLHSYNTDKKLNDLKFRYYIKKNSFFDSFITKNFKKDSIIIYGNVNVYSWSCKKWGYTPSLAKRFQKLGYQLYFQDEYYTSKLCCLCGVELENLRFWSKEEPVRGIVKCACIPLYRNRDINASINILNKFKKRFEETNIN